MSNRFCVAKKIMFLALIGLLSGSEMKSAAEASDLKPKSKSKKKAHKTKPNLEQGILESIAEIKKTIQPGYSKDGADLPMVQHRRDVMSNFFALESQVSEIMSGRRDLAGNPNAAAIRADALAAAKIIGSQEFKGYLEQLESGEVALSNLEERAANEGRLDLFGKVMSSTSKIMMIAKKPLNKDTAMQRANELQKLLNFSEEAIKIIDAAEGAPGGLAAANVPQDALAVCQLLSSEEWLRIAGALGKVSIQ
jgi:hypothetical protein